MICIQQNRLTNVAVLAVLLLVAGAPMAHAGSAEADQQLAVDLYQAAVDSCQAADWLAAASALERFATEHSNHTWSSQVLFFHAEAQRSLGDLALQQSDFENARGYFSSALTNLPEGERSEYCRKALEHCVESQAQRDAAKSMLDPNLSRTALIAIFNAGSAAEPHWTEATLRLVQADIQADKLTEAAAGVAAVLASNPPARWHAHALLLSGQLAALRKDWPQTRAVMQRYLEQSEAQDIPAESETEARFWLAEAQYRLLESPPSGGAVRISPDQVQLAFDAVVKEVASPSQSGRSSESSPWSSMVALRSAQLRARKGDWNAALELSSQLADRYPNFDLQFEANYLIGFCLAKRGEFTAAREAYLRAASHPAAEGKETAAKAQWMIGETYMHQQKFEEALGEYLRIEVLHAWPEWQAAGLLQAGSCYEMLSRPRSAAGAYARLVSRFPRSKYAKPAQERLLKMAADDAIPEKMARKLNQPTIASTARRPR